MPKTYKYKIEKKEGEIAYITQYDSFGVPEAVFKGYPNYKFNTFTLYQERLLTKGVEGYTKKIVDFKDVAPM